MAYKILVIYGSVRDDRQGIKAARFLEAKCKERGFEATLIDPKEYDLPLLNKMYKEYSNKDIPEILRKLGELVKEADGYVIVTAEYNHSIPAPLKNLLDHFLEEYTFKPSAIACYSAGGFGGVRAGVALRPILAEMGMPTISSMYAIPKVQDAFKDDGTPIDSSQHSRADRFLSEFEWYVEALKNQRKKGTPF